MSASVRMTRVFLSAIAPSVAESFTHLVALACVR
jgi:hypothetical protein